MSCNARERRCAVTWVKLDDKFHRNPKQLRMSDAAFRVYVRCLSYAADMRAELVTGFLTEVEVAAQGGQTKVVTELVGLNAWERVDGGYLIHDFEDYLPKSSTERVRVWRAKKRNAPEAVTQPKGNGPETVTYKKEGVSSGFQEPKATVTSHARRRAEPEPVPEPVVHNSPPFPPPSRSDEPKNGKTDDLGLQLAVRVGELLKRDLSAAEIFECGRFIDDFAYLDVDEALRRMTEHLAICADKQLPAPKQVQGFRHTLQERNDWLADHGTPKAWRPVVDVSTLTRAFPPKEATP